MIQIPRDAARTQSYLELHLPFVLASLTHEYILPNRHSSYETALIGHGELCLSTLYLDDGLDGACEGGHYELVRLLIDRGVNNWNRGLYGACRGGRLDFANLMVANGANHWDAGLYLACRQNHQELAKLMVQKGATQCIHCFHIENHGPQRPAYYFAKSLVAGF
jgi:hypothetical protein